MGVLDPAEFRETTLQRSPVLSAQPPPESLTFSCFVSSGVDLAGQNSLPSLPANPEVGSSPKLKEAVAEAEAEIILNALRVHGWNRNETAKILGINRTTLYLKMASYGIPAEPNLDEIQRCNELSSSVSEVQIPRLKFVRSQAEKNAVIAALEANKWVRRNTARALGINRTTLYKKMKMYGIGIESATQNDRT